MQKKGDQVIAGHSTLSRKYQATPSSVQLLGTVKINYKLVVIRLKHING